MTIFDLDWVSLIQHRGMDIVLVIVGVGMAAVAYKMSHHRGPSAELIAELNAARTKIGSDVSTPSKGKKSARANGKKPVRKKPSS